MKDQPFLAVLLGDAKKEIENCVVIIDGTRYPMRNLLQGMDVLFKVFFVFNVEYAGECKNVWEFIQCYFYEIPLLKKNAAVTRALKVFSKK